MKKIRKIVLVSAALLLAGCAANNSTERICPMQKKTAGPVVRTDAPELLFISIIPNFAGQEEYLANLILERHARTGIKYYAMSYGLCPMGDDVYEKPRIMKKSFHKLKQLLKGKPVKLGILFQSLLGMGGYWNMAPQFKMDAVKIMTYNGKLTHRPCPYDKNFLKYVDTAVSMLAEEGPEFCLTDDDVRMFRNTCFCKHHIEAVSKKIGKKLTRKEVVDAIKTASEGGDTMYYEFPQLRKIAKPQMADKIAKAWIETQVESIAGLCKTVRAALDRYNPAIPCGPCKTGHSYYADTQVKYLTAKNQKPFMRIANGGYLEGHVRQLGWLLSATGHQVVHFGNRGWTLLDESDNCPHNRYSRSATTMHAHIAAGIAQGLGGGKLWLDQGAYPIHEISRPYEDILGKYHGFYRELHRLASQWTMEGPLVRVPPLEQGRRANVCNDWNGSFFNFTGIATHYGDINTKGVTLLDGPVCWTDAQLKKILSGKVIVDGAAAIELTKRGFSYMTGVKAENKTCLANVEECLLTGIRTGFPAAMDGSASFKALPGTEVIGWAKFSQYTGAKQKVAMPATVYFRNKAGGEIITTALNVEKWHMMYVQNPARKLIALAWLKKLGENPIYLPADQHLKLFSANLPNGGKALTVINLSYDPLPVDVVIGKNPAKVLELQPEGDWKEVRKSYKKGTLSIDRTLRTGEIAVFKF